MKKTVLLISILFVNIFLAPQVLAGYQHGSFKVVSMRMSGSGVQIEFSPAPNACNGGAQYRMHARITKDLHPNYSALVSTLLTAYTTGARFRYIWFNDLPASATQCSSSGDDILELNMLELEQK